MALPPAQPVQMNNPLNILALNDDCFERIFDLLPLTDLRSFGQTCKFGKRVAEIFYEDNHSALVCVVNHEPNISADHVFDLENTNNLNICGVNLDAYRHVEAHCRPPIRRVYFESTRLSTENINHIKNILRKTEYVKISNSTIIAGNGLYEFFFKFCTNMKKLLIRPNIKRNPIMFPTLIGPDNGWLTQKYPTLEHLQIACRCGPQLQILRTFFEQNPNVRRFSSYSGFLLWNWDTFFSPHIVLDTLVIDYNGEDNNLNVFCKKINQLYERGAYQKLQWYNHAVSAIEASLNGLVVLKVDVWSTHDCIHISPLLKNVVELCIKFCTNGSDMVNTARNLANIERIYLGDTTIEAVASFIRHCPKLIKIKLVRGFDIWRGIQRPLPLSSWNQDRETLPNARKVKIYVPEDVYLSKKQSPNNKTDYKLLVLCRENSYDWINDFCD